MRRYGYAFFICLFALQAKESEFTLESDGFAVVETFSLTRGNICRKLDRHVSAIPLAWYTRDEWKAIYLMEREAKDSKEQEKIAGTSASAACQIRISRRTIVGPLRKGKWQIYGGNSAMEIKALPFGAALIVKAENSSYAFNTDKPVVIAALVQFYHNLTGGCREYVPLIFTPLKEKSTADLQILEVRAGKEYRLGAGRGLCRALPQTIGHGAIELQPGNYRLIGADLKRVVVYARQ
jgi:hypothetical protein